MEPVAGRRKNQVAKRGKGRGRFEKGPGVAPEGGGLRAKPNLRGPEERRKAPHRIVTKQSQGRDQGGATSRKSQKDAYGPKKKKKSAGGLEKNRRRGG